MVTLLEQYILQIPISGLTNDTLWLLLLPSIDKESRMLADRLNI